MTDPPPTPLEPGIIADPVPSGRPLGIVILGLLVLAIGVQSILVAFEVLEVRVGSLGALLSDPIQAKGFNIAFGALAIYAAVAMWFFWRPGWYVATLIAGVSMLLQIAQYVWGTPNYFSLTLAVVTAFYLNQLDVKIRFLKPRQEPTTVNLTVPRDAAP
jgi:hypothetical protein